MKNRGLGKGLSALISDQRRNLDAANKENQLGGITHIDITSIEAGKFQPRKVFNQEAIAELADSIMRHGIIQPIVVRKLSNSSKYEIIAGERRWRAAKIAGMIEVPVIVKDVDEALVAEQAIIENIQRENLNPLEEAEAYLELMSTHQYNQEELANAVGKKRSHVANMIRLTILPEPVKNHILNDKLSFSHAKVIAAHDEVEKIAEEIVTKGLSVRQTEQLIKSLDKRLEPKKLVKKKEATNNDDDFAVIAESLTEKLGIKVIIEANGSKGKIVINYNNYEQLDAIVEKLAATE